MSELTIDLVSHTNQFRQQKGSQHSKHRKLKLASL